MIILPRRYTSQPPKRSRVDVSHPILAGVSNAILNYGDVSGWRGNNATGEFGSLIQDPTLNGTLDSDYTDAGPALKFDGSTTYADFGAANIPYAEFTLLFGGIFDSFTSFGGVADCTVNGVSGWNIFQAAGGTLYFSTRGYSGDLASSGWPTGQTVHGALRNKVAGTCDWFRNGVQVASTTGRNPITVTNPLWVGNQRGGGTANLAARFSYFYLFDKYLSDQHIADIAVNPYRLFSPRRYVFPAIVSAAGGGLVGSNCLEDSTSATGAVAQNHSLLGANSTEDSSSGTGAVASGGVLAGANCVEDSVSSAGIIAQTHILSGANSAEDSTSATGSVSVAGALSGANCVEDSSSASGVITQTHILSGANCAEDSNSSTGAVAQNTILLIGTSCSEDSLSSVGAVIFVLNTNWILDSPTGSTWIKDSSVTNTWS